jgi:ATP-dependent DNA helicase RecG
LDRSVLSLDNDALVEQLRLNDGNNLKRAAVLLFHPDPERYFTGACIKIGYFRSETDLRFQDVVSGTLFSQVEKTVDLLQTKYLEAQIRYDGIHRVEEFAYPEAALREAVLNAVAHKDYNTGTPVQIKVYPERIVIWNPGTLMPPITIKRLSSPHPSVPFNPDVATTLFRAGLIESWGQGTLKIINACKAKGLPIPTFTDEFTGLMVTFYNGTPKVSGKASGKVSGKTSGKILTLIARNNEVTIPELAKVIGVTERSIERNLRKLQEQKYLKRVGGAKGGHWELVNKNP